MRQIGMIQKLLLRRLLAICLLLAGIGLAGCSSGTPLPDFVEKLVPVTGKLMLDGEPLAGATVTFTPDIKAFGGETAYGMTEADGSFGLLTQIPGAPPRKGIVEGRYIVTAFKLEMPDGSPVPKDMTDADAEAEGARHVVPPIYLDASSSPLKVEIKSGGEPLVLELKSRRR